MAQDTNRTINILNGDNSISQNGTFNEQSSQNNETSDDYQFQEDQMRVPLAHKLRSLAGGFLLHMVFGSQYIWGNISLYCLSHFYLMDHLGESDHSEHASMSEYKNVVSLGLPLIVVTSMTMMPIGSQI